MATKDKRIDAYITKSAAFTQPIMKHLRKLVHEACPEVEETIKWGFPHFDYKGEMMCSMAAFKQHFAFNFWKASLIKDSDKVLVISNDKSSMGSLGRIESMKDLPSDKIMKAYIKKAMKLNDEGVKIPSKTSSAEKKALDVPDYFIAALKKNKKALKTFEEFSYSNKKEYVSWVTEAKTEATRDSRLAQSVEWMAEGKIRNWKYLKK
jgi:uncharacterized protein YdeI (YjbR/CyaY-like superfamily)